jgi:hypothetical protein
LPQFVVDFLSHPAFWIVVAAASELIAHVATKKQQRCAARAAGAEPVARKKGLIRFGKVSLGTCV